MSHPLLAAEAGVRHLLLGNEAIVRGALEAGINVVTCYPGTPSSEIPDTFHYLASCGRYRMEYSVNEKVAVEVGAGAALAGAMSMTTMKHVGVNVAADPLFTAAYVGLPGGFVLVSADDPLCHSSQDEQDNRTYARFMGMPCFEPATAQEAKDMADTYAQVAREFIAVKMDTEQPNIFEEALLPSGPSSPNKSKNVIMGFMIGLILSCGVIVAQFLMDDRLRSADDIEKYVQLPTLGIMPKQTKSAQPRRTANKTRKEKDAHETGED